MKNIKNLSFILCFLITTLSVAQEDTTTQGPKTIDEQFSELIESSNNYQQFKVIDKSKINTLQAKTKERIESLNAEIADLKKQIAAQDVEAKKLESSLTETQDTLTTVETEKDSMNLFGAQMSKASYQAIVWGIAGVLLAGLLFFIYRFRNSNVLTREAQHKLDETEAEFDEYRRKALEKEQKLGRQLQDERNKLLKASKS